MLYTQGTNVIIKISCMWQWHTQLVLVVLGGCTLFQDPAALLTKNLVASQSAWVLGKVMVSG